MKWEDLNEIVTGNPFPKVIEKTDQQRVQNVTEEVADAQKNRFKFEVTKKLEGSSMTCCLIDDKFGVCSRNLDLSETGKNQYWRAARTFGIEDAMRKQFLRISWAGDPRKYL